MKAKTETSKIKPDEIQIGRWKTQGSNLKQVCHLRKQCIDYLNTMALPVMEFQERKKSEKNENIPKIQKLQANTPTTSNSHYFYNFFTQNNQL